MSVCLKNNNQTNVILGTLDITHKWSNSLKSRRNKMKSFMLLSLEIEH